MRDQWRCPKRLGGQRKANASNYSADRFAGVPRAPIYEGHGANDHQVDPLLAREMVGRYCAAGTPVLFDLIPGTDRNAAIFAGAPRAFNYLSDRFAGFRCQATADADTTQRPVNADEDAVPVRTDCK